MKAVYRTKVSSIEHVSTDTVRLKLSSGGRVVDGAEKLSPTSKETELSLEFVLRPAVADELRIGQSFFITIATEDSP